LRQQRKIKHRVSVLRHVEEISGNVAATCRYFGISRPTFYKWLRQYEEFGEEEPCRCHGRDRHEVSGRVRKHPPSEHSDRWDRQRSELVQSAGGAVLG
jgi:transposase-like protein